MTDYECWVTLQGRLDELQRDMEALKPRPSVAGNATDKVWEDACLGAAKAKAVAGLVNDKPKTRGEEVAEKLFERSGYSAYQIRCGDPAGETCIIDTGSLENSVTIAALRRICAAVIDAGDAKLIAKAKAEQRAIDAGIANSYAVPCGWAAGMIARAILAFK